MNPVTQKEEEEADGRVNVIPWRVRRIKSMYNELFSEKVHHVIPEPSAPHLLPPPNSTPTTTTATIHSRKTPKLTQGSRVRLIDRVEYVMNVRIDKNERIRILCLMQDLCDPQKQKGKRFKESHDFTLVYEDIFVPRQITYAYKMSRPSCVVCNRIIQVGEERCKYSVLNALNTHANCEKCGTHVYCLPCFVVLESTVIPGYQSVCFGTLLTQRGGCRQISVSL